MKKPKLQPFSIIAELSRLFLAISIGFIWSLGKEEFVISFLTFLLLTVVYRQAKRYGY